MHQRRKRKRKRQAEGEAEGEAEGKGEGETVAETACCEPTHPGGHRRTEVAAELRPSSGGLRYGDHGRDTTAPRYECRRIIGDPIVLSDDDGDGTPKGNQHLEPPGNIIVSEPSLNEEKMDRTHGYELSPQKTMYTTDNNGAPGT